VADGIKAHSIIAVKGDGPISGGTDWLIAYDSAQIERVESEQPVRSGNSVQSHPKAMEGVRRILLEHLDGADSH